MSTIRLSDLAAITGTTRDAIRDAQRLARTPWDEEEFSDAKQRRFGGAHALAMILLEMLAAQGFVLADAAEHVRTQMGVIRRFLDDAAYGSAQDAVLVAARVPVFDSLTGARWVNHVSTEWGAAEDIGGWVTEQIGKIGRVVTTRDGNSTVRTIGGPHLAVASVAEAYRTLKARAEQAGYIVDGHVVFAKGEGAA